jgi:excisionase family DNA binding protein
MSTFRVLASSADVIAATVDRPAQEHVDRLLTIDDVAKWLRVSKAWVYDHTTRKKPLLPCIRMGEMTRFRRSEIEGFIQEHARRNGPA